MATITTRQQFKSYCLRRLGFPVIEINVDDDQVDDRIDDAINFWRDYHYDGTEKLFMKHQITQADIDRQWIYAPDAVQFVTGIFRLINLMHQSICLTCVTSCVCMTCTTLLRCLMCHMKLQCSIYAR